MMEPVPGVFMLERTWGSNIYIIGVDDPVLIDAGFPLDERRIIRSLEGAVPSLMVATHYHIDHVGPLASLKRTGAHTPFEKEYIRKDGRRVELWIAGEPPWGAWRTKNIWPKFWWPISRPFRSNVRGTFGILTWCRKSWTPAVSGPTRSPPRPWKKYGRQWDYPKAKNNYHARSDSTCDSW